MRCPLPLILLLVLAAGGASSVSCAEGPAPAAADVFTARIAPILESQCLRCHGEARQKGHLKLNSRDAMLAGGSSGPAIIVGDPEHSLLITAVRYQDRDLQMPPDDRLTEEQIADLVRWIAAGAPWAQPESSP
ncbi:MAG: c-type cytochrome, partial [Planctomycetes bacterium]|nr:c-type cytochrome [Planctomycetota bacterium]